MEGKNDFPSKKLLMSPNAYAVFWRGNKFLVEGVKRNAEIHGGVEENAEIPGGDGGKTPLRTPSI